MNKVTLDTPLDSLLTSMLMTLNVRAEEAKRPDSILKDPEAIRIRESLDFDFIGHFGEKPHGGMASRAACFDNILTNWLHTHPNGHVINLGEGLETQRCRLDNGTVRWLSVDLPKAVILREKFLMPTDRFKHIAGSAFDFAWMEHVDPSQGVFIAAQGLFMYFQEETIRQLVIEIFRRFPKAHLLFDFVSRRIVRRTQTGFPMTSKFNLPPMAWGVEHDNIDKTMQGWLPGIKIAGRGHYDTYARGLPHVLIDRLLRRIPSVGNQLPGFVLLTYDCKSPPEIQ